MKIDLAHNLFNMLTQVSTFQKLSEYGIIKAAQPIFNSLKNNLYNPDNFKQCTAESLKTYPHLDYFVRYLKNISDPTPDTEKQLSELTNCINSGKFLCSGHENEIKMLFVILYNTWRSKVFFEDFINKKNSDHWIQWFLKIATCCLKCSTDISHLYPLKTPAQTDIWALQLIYSKPPENWEDIVINLMNHTIRDLENEQEKNLEIHHDRTTFEYYLIAADFLAKEIAHYTKNVQLKTLDHIDTFNNETSILHYSLKVFDFFEHISKNSTAYVHTSYWGTTVLPRLWENIYIAQFESAKKLFLFTETHSIKKCVDIYSKIFYQLEYILLPKPEPISFIKQTETTQQIIIYTITFFIKFYEKQQNKAFLDFYYDYFITYAKEKSIFLKENASLIEPFNIIVEYFWEKAKISLKKSYYTSSTEQETITTFLNQWFNFIHNTSDFL